MNSIQGESLSFMNGALWIPEAEWKVLSSLFLPHVCHLHAQAAVFLPPTLFLPRLWLESRNEDESFEGFSWLIRELNVISHGEVEWKCAERVSNSEISFEVTSVSSPTDLIMKTHRCRLTHWDVHYVYQNVQWPCFCCCCFLHVYCCNV